MFYSPLSTRDFTHVSLLSVITQLPLWRTRPDVVAAGIAHVLEKAKVQRQEAIFELILSEKRYLADLSVLLEVCIY